MFVLDPAQRNIHRATVDFAKTLRRDLREADREEIFSREQWKRCAEHGLLGLGMPAEFGGTADGALTTAVAFQGFGYGCPDNGLAFSLVSQLTSVQVPIARHGSSEVRERFLRGLISGELIGAHGASEPDAGSDVTRIRTVARKVDGGYRISGVKTFSTLGPVSDLALVLAKIDGEDGKLGELVVPRECYEVSRPLEKLGLRTSPMSELILENAFVPESHLIGKEGDGLTRFLTTMEWERLLIMAGSLGAMERQFEQCREYARERRQFDATIGSFQAVSHRLVDMRLRIESSKAMLYGACARKDAAGRAMLEAAMVKLHLSEARVANALDAVRIFGGYGVMTENEIERELRDAIPGLIYSGTSEILKNTIARLLGL